jgi:zinc/manganese transport system substrate-binding protein/manganese/iron transport system substrate-binding protein
MRPGIVLLAVLIGGVTLGCEPPSSTSSGALRVVATTTVLGDLVANAGGDDVEVVSLVPRGGEVHTFDPSPGDMGAVSEADLVFVNGLGLDEWAIDLADDAGVAPGRVVELAEDLPGVSYIEGDEGADAGAEGSPEAGHGDEAINPHLWLDVTYAAAYVDRIAEQLGAADPARAAAYRERAGAYRDRLLVLDGWARDQLAAIPAERRRIVSLHDALPYFARAYGLEIVGVVIDAPGQDPSAGEVADLIDAIRSSDVRVIASEVQFPADLVGTIAEETGAMVVADLYTDSLGDLPVDSYEALIRHDVERFVDALR